MISRKDSSRNEKTNVTIIQYVNPFRRLDTHPPCSGSEPSCTSED